MFVGTKPEVNKWGNIPISTVKIEWNRITKQDCFKQFFTVPCDNDTKNFYSYFSFFQRIHLRKFWNFWYQKCLGVRSSPSVCPLPHQFTNRLPGDGSPTPQGWLDITRALITWNEIKTWKSHQRIVAAFHTSCGQIFFLTK